jgi:hypothetical protein
MPWTTSRIECANAPAPGTGRLSRTVATILSEAVCKRCESRVRRENMLLNNSLSRFMFTKARETAMAAAGSGWQWSVFEIGWWQGGTKAVLTRSSRCKSKPRVPFPSMDYRNSHSTVSMIITNGTGDVGQDTSNVDEDVEELDESRCFRFRL